MNTDMNDNNHTDISKHDKLLLNIDRLSQLEEREKNNIYKTDDYKFYRKRIFQLVKDIMNKRCENAELQHSFSTFVKDSIEYLKFVDKAEIIQQEYEASLFLKDRNGEDIGDSQKTPFGLGIIPEEVNNLICKEHELRTLDIQKCLNIKTIHPQEKKINPPVQKEYNLKDPKFKNKGLTIHKKNVNE